MVIDFYMRAIILFLQTLIAYGDSITPFDSLQFKNPVIDICPSQKGIFILQDDRIFDYSPSSGVMREIPLGRRFSDIKGFFQDSFFFYLYTKDRLYFIKRGDIIDSLMLGKVTIEKGEILEGEIFLLDSKNGRIMVIPPSRRMRYIGRQVLLHPIDMGMKPSGEIGVIDRGQRSLISFDRIGNLKERIPLPSSQIEKIAIGSDNYFYLADPKEGIVWRVDRGNYDPYRMKVLQIERLVSFDDYLFILIPWYKILIFKILD